MKKARPTPTTKPTTTPSAMFSGMFGRTGRTPASASSVISTMVDLGQCRIDRLLQDAQHERLANPLLGLQLFLGQEVRTILLGQCRRRSPWRG